MFDGCHLFHNSNKAAFLNLHCSGIDNSVKDLDASKLGEVVRRPRFVLETEEGNKTAAAAAGPFGHE